MLSTKDIDDLKQELQTRLGDLQKRLDSIKRDAVQPHSDDWSEQAQERENDEVIDAIGNETRQSIADINAALNRIVQGNYGVCVGCGEDIEISRLRIVPEAARCSECAG